MPIKARRRGRSLALSLLATAVWLLAGNAAAQGGELRPYQQPPTSRTTGQFQGQRGFGLQFMLGPGYQRVYSLNVVAADIEANFGGQARWGAIFGGVHASFGRSEAGLFVNGLHLQSFYEAQLRPVRLGIGLQLGMLGIVRATNASYHWAPGAGPRGHIAVDMATWDSGAIFLNGRLGVMLGTTRTAVPNVGLHLGARFF